MVIVIILLATAFVWYSIKNKKQTEASAEPVIEEALAVVNDFLNIGRDASILTDSDTDFSGFIIYVPDARPPYRHFKSRYGFRIQLCDVSDLTIKANKYPKLLTNNPDMANRYNTFIRKYQNCYDASEKAYVYKTERVVSLSKRQRMRLHARLSQEIEERCALADFSGGLLYTKNVAR